MAQQTINNGDTGLQARTKINENNTELYAKDTSQDITIANNTAKVSYTDAAKVAGIEAGAEVNNISDVNATDLTDGGASTLHYHVSDRARANHTGTQTASTISDFDTEVSNNASVVANTAKISYTDASTVSQHDSDLDGILNEPVTSLVSTTWTIDTESLRSKDTQITSADATAKTIALSNVNATADRVIVGIHAIMTTACTVTYPSGTTFVDSAPTFADGEEWLIALISHDNGTSWNGLARQLV